MKKTIYYFKTIILISLTVFFTACGTDENEGVNSVGNNFLSASDINEVNASTNLAYIQGAIDVNATNAFTIKNIKIIYKTKDEQGNIVNASGTLTIPTPTSQYLDYLKSVDKTFSISTIVEHHGTIFTNAEAPSNSIGDRNTTTGAPISDTGGIALLMSAYAGFAVVMPDYLGYGESNSENHTYMLKKSSAQVSIDMLNASVRYMADNGIAFNGQVYISGYSQGGYIAMAMAKELEENHSSVYSIKGLAPLAGPHDLLGLGDIEIDANKTMVYPAFLAYLANSYSNEYSEILLTDLINDINTSNVNSLFDGSNSNVAIHTNLGLVIDARAGFNHHKANVLFKDSYINDYKNNTNNAFKLKLEENSVYDWTPKTEIKLVHCIDDEIIPFSMSQTAYNKFIANGASTSKITLTPIPTSVIPTATNALDFVHSRCASKSYGAAVSWFSEIRGR